MPNKRINSKKPRKVKRFIYACPVAPGGFDDEGNLYMEMMYVLDTGNLITDVQKRLQSKTICIHNYNYEYEERIYERCVRARQKLKHDLESQIYATGANSFNAEVSARQLLEKMR